MVDLASGLGMGMEQLIRAAENMLFPFFSAILGGTSEMLFERVLFLTIILAVVYIVTSKMPVFDKNKPVIWIVSISIALLSTRFLVEEGLLKTMMLPYSVFGIAISSAFPLLIYFTFVESFNESAIVRKMLWTFYVVVFIGIWGARYDDVGGLSWIYLLSAGAGFLFLVFDGTIRDAITKGERKLMDVKTKETHLAKLREQLEDLGKNERHYTPSIFKKMVKDKSKQIRRASKAKF